MALFLYNIKLPLDKLNHLAIDKVIKYGALQLNDSNALLKVIHKICTIKYT